MLQVKAGDQVRGSRAATRHPAKRAAEVKAELRAGGLLTHGGAEELTARLAECILCSASCSDWSCTVQQQVVECRRRR